MGGSSGHAGGSLSNGQRRRFESPLVLRSLAFEELTLEGNACLAGRERIEIGLAREEGPQAGGVELRFDELMGQSDLVGVTGGRIEIDEHLALPDRSTFLDVDEADHPTLGRLHDLVPISWDDAAPRNRDNIQCPDTRPDHRGAEGRHDDDPDRQGEA